MIEIFKRREKPADIAAPTAAPPKATRRQETPEELVDAQWSFSPIPGTERTYGHSDAMLATAIHQARSLERIAAAVEAIQTHLTKPRAVELKLFRQESIEAESAQKESS